MYVSLVYTNSIIFMDYNSKYMIIIHTVQDLIMVYMYLYIHILTVSQLSMVFPPIWISVTLRHIALSSSTGPVLDIFDDSKIIVFTSSIGIAPGNNKSDYLE